MQKSDFTGDRTGDLVRIPNGVWAFDPKPLPPELGWTSKLATALSNADHALGRLAEAGRTLPNPHLFIRPFLRREAVLSSRIEGTQTSLPDLYQIELFPLVEPRRPDDREVLNYVVALETGLARLSSTPLCLRLIRDLHGALMESVRGQHKSPGRFRDGQNHIGPLNSPIEDATYVPPPVHQMKQALYDLEAFLNAPSDIPPLIRIAMIHYQFEAIHPFWDGNGRIGRLLVSLLLCAWQLIPQPLLYLSAFLEKHVGNYKSLLLAVSQRGDWDGWLRFFLRGIREQSVDALERTAKLSSLRQSYHVKFEKTRASARLLRLVDHLFGFPWLTVNGAAELLEVTYPSAARMISRLTDEGILREVTGRARNRVFLAQEILRVIDAP